MKRTELEHIVRAVATNVGDGDFVVIGSQAVLGTYHESELPPDATMSIEADILFTDDPDKAKADLVDGTIGEGSHFHRTHHIYGQGVSSETPKLPAGWQNRLVYSAKPKDDPSPGYVRCLEVHDVVVSKLVANREKDRSFAVALLRERLVDADTLKERAATVNVPSAERKRLLVRIDRCVKEANDTDASGGVQGLMSLQQKRGKAMARFVGRGRCGQPTKAGGKCRHPANCPVHGPRNAR